MSPVYHSKGKSSVRCLTLAIFPFVCIIIQNALDDVPEMWQIWSLSMGVILLVIGFFAAAVGRSQYNRRSYVFYVTIIVVLVFCLIPSFIVAVGVETAGQGERLGLIAGETVFLLTLTIYDYQKWRENHREMIHSNSSLISAPIQSYGATEIKRGVNLDMSVDDTSDSEGSV